MSRFPREKKEPKKVNLVGFFLKNNKIICVDCYPCYKTTGDTLPAFTGEVTKKSTCTVCGKLLIDESIGE